MSLSYAQAFPQAPIITLDPVELMTVWEPGYGGRWEDGKNLIHWEHHLESIKQNGQIHPVTLNTNPDDLRVLDGHHRIVCLYYLGQPIKARLIHLNEEDTS